MTSICGVVLDLDDTLFLERDYVASGFRSVGEWCRDELGVNGVEERAWDLFENGVRQTVLTDALGVLGVEVGHDLRASVVEVYRRHRPDIELLPDARRFIRLVHGTLPIAVVTDGPAASQRAKAEALGVDLIADPVVVTAEMGLSKPHPDVFRRAVRDWHLPADSLVYIGDNPHKDFQGPLSLGWNAVRVRRAGSMHEAAPTPDEVRQVDSLDGAEQWLHRRGHQGAAGLRRPGSGPVMNQGATES